MVAVTHLALARSQITGTGILGFILETRAVTSVAAFSMYVIVINYYYALLLYFAEEKATWMQKQH